MSEKELSTTEVLARAKKIVKGLAGLKNGDGLWVLYTAINQIVMQADRKAPRGTIRPVNANLWPRHRGRTPKIDSDPEIRAFIHGLDERLTIRRLREILVDKFGSNRVPSENTLGKYLKRLSQSIQC